MWKYLVIEFCALVLFSSILLAAEAGRIDAAVNNVPIAYDKTAGSVLIAACSGKHFEILNNAGEEIEYSWSSAVENPIAAKGFITNGGSVSKDDVRGLNIADIHIRVIDGSASTAGIVRGSCW